MAFVVLSKTDMTIITMIAIVCNRIDELKWLKFDSNLAWLLGVLLGVLLSVLLSVLLVSFAFFYFYGRWGLKKMLTKTIIVLI